MKAALLNLALLLPVPAAAEERAVAAVLSAGKGAYLEAYSAFREAYGADVAYTDLSAGARPDLSGGVKVVAAFGGKAASHPYPPGLPVVYSMAPGIRLGAPGRQRASVKISLLPRPEAVLTRLKAMQPELKRLTVFCIAEDAAEYAALLEAEGARADIRVETVRMTVADELPRLLRLSLDRSDAFWLPADPLLVTPETLRIFAEFSRANGVPFYASNKSLAREGAVAAVGAGYREIGAAAAAAVKDFEAGRTPPALVFPESVELTLNASAARRFGIKFPEQLLKEAAYLLP